MLYKMATKILGKSAAYVFRNIKDFDQEQKESKIKMDDFDKRLNEDIANSRLLRKK